MSNKAGLFFRTTSIESNGIDSNSVPLKFEDIVDKKIYDKMRPPKPGGKDPLSRNNGIAFDVAWIGAFKI